jgi:acetylornithine deacetylase/succinyl-diaminopimelate desuccinylase-like protein
MPANDELTQLLCDLIARPSVNPEWRTDCVTTPYGEDRMARYVQDYFQPWATTERQEALPGRENVIVHVPGEDAAALPVLLEAHMDTVDVQGMEQPFAPRVEGGRVYGRGACDTKGSLAVMMLVLKQLIRERAVLPRACVLAATVDEEFGMSGARRLVGSGAKYAGAIVGEPTGLSLVAAHDGQMYVRIAAHGKAAHTSNPQHGVNAIYLISEVINVLRHRAEAVCAEREHPLCGPPKLTVSVIHGGVSEHIVPDLCEIAIDCRVIPGETCQSMLEEIKDSLREDLAPAVLDQIEFAAPHKAEPPMETAADHPLVRGLGQAATAVIGDSRIVGAAYNTNASHYSAAGIPCVVFGPGEIAQAHSAIEFVEIEQLEAAAQILRRFLLQSAAVAG